MLMTQQLQNLPGRTPPFTYEGKQYTAYKAQQQRRKIERAMRKQKDRCIAADAAGETEMFTAASIKHRRQKDIYEDFCKAGCTPSTSGRSQRDIIGGLEQKRGQSSGHRISRKNLQTTLTDSDKGGIINNKAKPNGDIYTISRYASKNEMAFCIQLQDAFFCAKGRDNISQQIGLPKHRCFTEQIYRSLYRS